MSAVPILHKKFVCTDIKDNHNKFWEILVYGDGTGLTRYGRVGASFQERPFTGGLTEAEAKIRDKQKPRPTGTYVEVDVIDTPSAQKVDLHAAVKEQIKTDNSVVADLIAMLAAENKHQILEFTNGQMDVTDSGIVKTALGVVSADTIQKARTYLGALAPYAVKQDFDNTNFMSNLEGYLSCIPQKVGHSRGWHHHFLTDQSAIERQNTFLEQLETSIQLAAATPKVDLQVKTVFDVKLDVVTDKKLEKRIFDEYYRTAQRQHSCSHMKPVRVFSVQINTVADAFKNDGAKLTNIQQLWHGTRTFNLLSILKQGLVIPDARNFNVCGRMFGNGVYFSDQSSKSLNYAYGYWSGSRQSKCYMFLADVALGKQHIAKHPDSSFNAAPKGFDSVFGKAGVSGVMNNEMIVYRTSQINLTYLVEFEG